MKKPILYIDMDNVIVDFKSALKYIHPTYLNECKNQEDNIPYIFSKMTPLPGAIRSINQLINSNLYDIYILSTAPFNNPTAWSDKLNWIKKYLPDYFTKRLILTHHKNLNIGDYLIDDKTKNGADQFTGELIKFNSNTPELSWKNITKRLIPNI